MEVVVVRTREEAIAETEGEKEREERGRVGEGKGGEKQSHFVSLCVFFPVGAKKEGKKERKKNQQPRNSLRKWKGGREERRGVRKCDLSLSLFLFSWDIP